MNNNFDYFLISPKDVILSLAQKVKKLRLEQNITQSELASRIGVSTGTIKRFEKSGEIQLLAFAKIALVVDRLDDLKEIFAISDKPSSLYNIQETKPRQRARK